LRSADALDCVAAARLVVFGGDGYDGLKARRYIPEPLRG
jgi:hypothetical protein